jgi:hypothetical protein
MLFSYSLVFIGIANLNIFPLFCKRVKREYRANAVLFAEARQRVPSFVGPMVCRTIPLPHDADVEGVSKAHFTVIAVKVN